MSFIIEAVNVLNVTRNGSKIFILWESILSKALVAYNVTYTNGGLHRGSESLDSSVNQTTINVMTTEHQYVIGVEAIYMIGEDRRISKAKGNYIHHLMFKL